MNSGFKDALSDSGMSMYSLSKQTGLPYTTINRLVNEKLSINNCNAGAVFKIASALGVQMEVLMKGECVYTLDEIAERIAPVAKKYNIPKVYIFGSYARGEANPDSDVDLITTRSLTQERAQKYSKVFIDNLENDRRLIYG